MKEFMGKNYLLTNKVAKQIFHAYAEDMPIIDFHSFLDPMNIYEDTSFKNVTQLLLSNDQQKHELMRSFSIPEKYITGNASDHEKFSAFAGCLEKAIGNPVFTLTHLELRRYFDYTGVLSGDTCEYVWNLGNECLKDRNMSVRNLIIQGNVDLIATTADPADALIYHQKIAEDPMTDFQVMPVFSPERVFQIESKEFLSYLDRLSDISKVRIHDFSSLVKALKKRKNYFAEHGCVHAFHENRYQIKLFKDQLKPGQDNDEVLYELADLAIKRRCLNEVVSKEDGLLYKIALYKALTELYKKEGWTVSVKNGDFADFLNWDKDNLVIRKGLFISDYVYNGSIEIALKELSKKVPFGTCLGAASGNGSYLSFVRHEYFRRVLCNYIGNIVEEGHYPFDELALQKIVEDICYYNGKKYFII